MAINYDAYLSADQKKTIVETRLQQFAAEAYQTELNKAIQISQGNESATEAYNVSLELLDSAIKIHEEELVKLKEELIKLEGNL